MGTWSRRRVSLRLLVFVAVIMIGMPGAVLARQTYGPRCFDVPGIAACIEDRFRQFWEQGGGLAVFGYPITPAANWPSSEGNFLTQYFERARFEYHPEMPPPSDVLLGRIGDDRLKAQGQEWWNFPKADPALPHYFEATGHAIGYEPFWRYWQSRGLRSPNLTLYEGSLALFGLPLSEPTMATNATGATVLTQWFERARFEDHGPAGVLLGLLGAETRPLQPLEPMPVPPPIPEPPSPPVPPGGDNVVYLTFDDGPFGSWTQQILQLLARYNARATFFVIGRQVPAFSHVLDEAARAGSTFANHTYNHATLAGISREAFRQEVLQTEAVLGPYATRCLRPPGGATDANTYAFAQELGYRIVLWDIDPKDWARPGADVIAARVLQNIAPGKVVLLHDGGGERSQTVAALETILATLSAQGYRFEPVC